MTVALARMARSFDLLAESPARVEQVHSTFKDEKYWLARLAAFGGIGMLESLIVGPDDTVAVTILQDLRHDLLPGLLAKIYPADLAVLHKETWIPINGGQVRGEVSFSARGAPGSGVGKALLAPVQNGSRLKFNALVEIKVPLVGGTIEHFVGGHVVKGIVATHRFTTDWITGDA
jgi:Protein of unknown function (DUF2505)